MTAAPDKGNRGKDTLPAALPGATGGRIFAPRRSDRPRKVRGGIKLEGVLERGHDSSVKDPIDVPGRLLAKQFESLLESVCSPTAWAEGTTYARQGQIASVDIRSGSVAASVQGTAARPYSTRIDLPAFEDRQWDRVVEVMADEAVHVAKLLTGAWPQSIEQRLESSGVALLPASTSELKWSCTCGAPELSSTGCKHVAAIARITAELLACSPQQVFMLRGRSPELLLHHLQSARMISGGHASASRVGGGVAGQGSAVPLEACLEDFWRAPDGDSEAGVEEDAAPSVPHVPHALLRRMGPSPLNGRFPMAGLLASVYDAVSAAARRWRDGDVGGFAVPPEIADANDIQTGDE